MFDHFKYRYDSSPRGDDESVCPLCGAVEPRATWIDDEEDTRLTKEQVLDNWENGYFSSNEERGVE